jgi:DNA-3-methyladenine glycosylase
MIDAAPLPRSFYDRPTDEVARELIGCLIVHRDGEQVRIARIVETEAYLGERDLACHSSKGRTPRTEVMFGPPGHAYVYFIYGMHFCLNAVTGPVGCAEAVLIRAAEPIALCHGAADGPGKLCRALGIDRRHNGLDLTAGPLTIAPGDGRPLKLARAPRVGVEYSGAWARRLLRFYERDSLHVSRAGGVRPKARR